MKTIDRDTPLTAETVDRFLDVLATAPIEVDHILNGRSFDQLRSKRSAEEFSLVENICHLRDIEIEAYTIRLQRILSEERPTLPDIDGSRLAIERDYNCQSAKEACDQFSRARSDNVSRLRGIDVSQLEREGLLEGVGAVSLEKLLWLMHEHDKDHLSDMRVVCDWLDRTSQD